MLSDIKSFWKVQRAPAFMFTMSLFWLLASAIGVAVQFSHGHLLFGAFLTVVVLVCAYIAWMIGMAQLAVTRQWRTNGTTE